MKKEAHESDPTHVPASSNAPPDAKQSPDNDDGAIGDRVLDILQDIEGQFDRLRGVQQAQEEEITALSRRQDELDQAEQAMRDQRTELAHQRSEIEQQTRDLQKQKQSLESQHAEQRSAIAQQQEQLNQQQHDIEAKRAELESERDQHQQQRQALDADRANWAEQLQHKQAEQQKKWAELEELDADYQHHKASLEAARKELDEQRNAFASREKTLQQRLDSHAKLEADLKAHEQQILQQTDKLKQAKTALEAQKQQHDAAVKQRQAALQQQTEDLQKREQQASSQLQQFESLQEELKQREAALAEQTASIETERAALQGRLHKAEAVVDDLGRHYKDVQKQLKVSTEELETTAEARRIAEQRLTELEPQLGEAINRAEQAETDALKMVQATESERDALAAKLDEMSEQHQALAEQYEQASTEIQSLNKKLAEQSKAFERARKDLAEYQQKLTLATEKLAKFAELLKEHTPKLERGAAAAAMVEQQRRQIDRLTQQLAQANVSSDPEELHRKEQRIRELTEALRQARGQTAGTQDASRLQEQISELEAQVNMLRMEAENAKLEAVEAKRQLKDQIDAVASDEVAAVKLAEQEAEISDLSAQLDALRKEREDLSQRPDPAELQQLLKQIEELETELKEARAAARNSGSGKGSESKQLKNLKEKAQRIHAVADHLRRRRARLSSVRRILKQRRVGASISREDMNQRSEALRRLEQERLALAQLKDVLSAAEKRMIRRWAAPRAVVTLTWFVLLAAVMAGASWFASNEYFPATHSASVTLLAESDQVGNLSADELKTWQNAHVDLLRDNNFLNTLAKRMSDRYITTYSGPSELRAAFQGDVTIDLQDADAITLSMAGTDPNELVAFLDIVAATIASESSREAARFGNGIKAAPAETRGENGEIHHASLNSVPVKDERLIYAVPIFGGAMVFSLLVIGLIYSRLIRAKRIFDEETTVPDEAVLLNPI